MAPYLSPLMETADGGTAKLTKELIVTREKAILFNKAPAKKDELSSHSVEGAPGIDRPQKTTCSLPSFYQMSTEHNQPSY